MSYWRARHYFVRVNRRTSIKITVRRFRLARPAAGKRQKLINIRIGRVRQLCFEYKHGRRKLVRQAYARKVYANFSVLLILLGCAGVVFSTAQLHRTYNLQPAHKVATAIQTKQPPHVAQPHILAASTPTHITIASQRIDVDLVPVGLAQDGSIELPPVTDWLAGWYKYSPTPGELGPSVIVGHVDSYQGISVFWNLRYVMPGDTIDVTRSDGSTAHFSVTKLEQYDQNSFPTNLVYGDTPDAELRVITCGGTFDTSMHAYSQNTVVYATLTP